MIGAITLTHLQHSHLWVTFGPRWGRWLLSPAHHQIHHSMDVQHHNRNFGNTLALFDRLFGTLYVPGARREPLRLGVEGGGMRPHGWRNAVFAPFGKAWALRPHTPNPLAQPDPSRANAGHG
jgi:sterol desaturase/sphingolipid hydroxylase (fatty acid hydroxylase superfamily)